MGNGPEQRQLEPSQQLAARNRPPKVGSLSSSPRHRAGFPTGSAATVTGDVAILAIDKAKNGDLYAVLMCPPDERVATS